jgi:lysophospholipase L1-like esterase
MTRASRFATTLALLAVVAVPLHAQRGAADFTRFVALGDSFGVGVTAVGMNAQFQQYSWPAIIARQVGLDVHCATDGPRCFQIPYVSDPGIPPGLRLVSLSPLIIDSKPGLGTPLNLALPRPYNNLSVDGAEVADMIRPVSGDGVEAFNAEIVHRNLGVIVNQAIALNPTFIAIWIGGNDAFNGVQRGMPSQMTSVADFTRDYAEMLDRLTAGAPNAGMIVGTLPTNIRVIPFVNVVPPVLVDPATRQPVLDPAGNMIPFIADLGGGVFGQLPPGSAVLLPSTSLLATGYGIPAQLAPLFPNLPDVGKPLPDSAVLTPAEIAAIEQRLRDFNAAITSAAAARNIPVADIDAFLNRAAAGIQLGPIRLDLSFITGGIISIDGFHLTSLGYALFANEYIRTINRAYGTRIPVASLPMFFQGNDPTSPNLSAMTELLGLGVPQVTPAAAEAMTGGAPQPDAPPTPSPTRARAARGGRG